MKEIYKFENDPCSQLIDDTFQVCKIKYTITWGISKKWQILKKLSKSGFRDITSPCASIMELSSNIMELILKLLHPINIQRENKVMALW